METNFVARSICGQAEQTLSFGRQICDFFQILKKSNDASNKYIIILQMIRKNKPSTAYLNHPLNNSPSKTAIKFAKQPRFLQKKTFSPDKFYELPDTRHKRSTTFGYGDKTNFELSNINEPAKYHLRTEFDEIAQGYRFGVRRQIAELTRQRSARDITQPKSSMSTVHDPRQSQRSKSPTPVKKRSPQTSNKRYQDEEKSRGQSVLQNTDQNKQKKSAYRFKYEYSNGYLLDDKRSSYIQFLNQKKERTPVKHLQSTFGFDQRWKEEPSFRNIGPGSYNRFSEFGQNENCY